jgi:hypothetical protein
MPGPVGVDEPVVGSEEFAVVGVLNLVHVLVGAQVILKMILKWLRRYLNLGNCRDFN